MDTLRYLNAFISERLTAAAVEIFGAVEKTLIDYQGEISRSKQEIDHLRTLVLWPEVRLHRSAQQVSAHCCDEEASPVSCHEEDVWSPDVSPEHPSTLHTKDQRADQRGPSWRQPCDTTVFPQFVKRQHHEDSPSHLYRVLTAEQTADIKTEPDGDDFITSPSTREAEIPCGENPESSGLQRLEDPLEITHHEQDVSDEQQYTEQDCSSCQDHEDPDPPHIKVERFTSSAPVEETDRDYKLPLQSGRSVCAEKKSRDGEGESYELSRVSQPFYSVNPDYLASQSEYGDRTEGVVNGEWIKVLTPTGTIQKKRQNSNLCFQERVSIETEEELNYFTRERRHTCPICAKRFKESSHLRDHVRIHTGEKPYQCKECSKNFRQSGALTLHMRIHTGERPYQCADCGRRFNRKGDMETHRVTHTGERPHLCMVCGKSFKRKSNLNTHLKTHAEDKMDYTQPL